MYQFKNWKLICEEKDREIARLKEELERVKRLERLTKYGETSHENGVCCTHFNSKECHEVAGNCAYGCKWEEEAWSKLAHYEDLEEQGLLLKLPCKVGDEVYFCGRKVLQCKVEEIVQGKHGFFMHIWYNGENELLTMWHTTISQADFGETVFFTKAEAEKALAEMEK